MKNKIKWYSAIVVFCLIAAISACEPWDDYKKYIDEDTIYPQKPDSLKTYPGKYRILLKWIITDPKVTSCKVFYSQEGIQDSVTVPVNANHNYANDTVQVIINELIESECFFKIISYDDFGHKSLTVETEEVVYGDNYQKSLINRTIKSKQIDENGRLHLQWYSAVNDTELGVELQYNDATGNQKIIFIPNSATTTMIADFNINYPFSYHTLYLPTATAIDTFYTLPNEEKITFPSELVNTTYPFAVTSKGLWLHNRAGTVSGWIVNGVIDAQGSVDSNWGYRMMMWGWTGYTPAPSTENGKIYQTLSLPAGTYSFQATVFNNPPIGKVYLVVNNSYSLSDFDNIEMEALSYCIINTTGVSKCEFVLGSPSVVSLGLVGNIGPNEEIIFDQFELIKD